MKKNLRIVSVAAAALLAVAPVAASAVSVNAAANTELDFGTTALLPTSSADVNVTPNITAIAAVKSLNVPASVSGNVTATFGGQSYTANLASNTTPVLHTFDDKKQVNAKDVQAGVRYYATMNNVSLNFGSQNANKNVTIHIGGEGAGLDLAAGYVATGVTNPSTKGATVNARTDKDGVINFASITTAPFYATDATDAKVVSFLERSNGQVVTTGSLTVNAGNESVMNVEQILSAFNAKYQAAQLNNANRNENKNLLTTSVSDLADQLKKQNIDVNANGYFTAPKSFTLNFSAKSGVNNAATTMAVTVNVPNGKEVTPATVPSTGNVTIMHAAYTYELKDGKLTRVSSADTLHAYSEVPVYGTTTVNGKKYYRVSGEHEWYINAGNVDGTSRTLNHNSYVYNNKGKRVKSEGTWKKGSKHTTYGAAMNIKGNRMYRVNKNRYVKVVNFD